MDRGTGGVEPDVTPLQQLSFSYLSASVFYLAFLLVTFYAIIILKYATRKRVHLGFPEWSEAITPS